MFRIMLQKMWHKKWMNICLLLGCILLTATVVSFPIYRSAAYDRMLSDEFNNFVTNEGRTPALIKGSISAKKEQGGGKLRKMDEFADYIYNTLGVEESATFRYLNVTATTMSSDTGRKDASEISVRLSAIDYLPEHSKILVGDMYSEKGISEDGAIECVISQSALVDLGLLVGEHFTFDAIKLPDKSPLRIVITGVYDRADEAGYFWQMKPEKLSDSILCNPAVFREYFTGDNAQYYSLASTSVAMFDFSSLTADDVERIKNQTEYIYNESTYQTVVEANEYMGVIDAYNIKVSRISATLLILQVPVFAMLVAFLMMISGQMYEMEKNEISVIKSRGSSSGQIIRLYFFQGLVITVTGGLLGLPLGALFARILGATRNFLEFDFSQSLEVAYTKEAFIYAAAAVLVCLLSITIPSLKHSKVSIVKLKQSKALKKKGLWEKLYVDILLLLVSLYGFYSFNKNGGNLSNSVMSGESLDPLLYFSSSLFIVGAGLFFLRIQPYLVKLIYIIGKRNWGPASHVSFLDNIKNGRKQQLIMLFLIMTISLGMYHATVARTILDNAIENTDYLAGADVIIKEKWTEILDRYGNYTGEYSIPDFGKYGAMEAASEVTKVLFDEKAYFRAGSDIFSAYMYGINTKQFGEITMVDREFLDKHYYDYLNDLAVVENGVLLSTNFNTKLGYKVGDTFTFYNSKGMPATCKIVGFISYFPGYNSTTTALNPDGTALSKDNYLVVSHFDFLNQKMGTVPYEVWIQLKDGYDSVDVYNWVQENKLTVSKYVNKENKLDSTMSNPLLQGTNGVLTMGFVVTLVLCAVGYLIYWVMSIRERELIFGVLRATGFHKTEIIHMLINEQIFSGLFSVLAGIGIGKLTSKLYVPILQQAYASEEQALPMRLITVASDMYRLYAVIGFVMILALVVLIGILSKMNVTKALKLGEE